MESIPTGVKENILRYHRAILDDPHHSSRSWEHCYSCFQRLQSSRNERNLDSATLQLAFYLASWGMYRGSSKLLRKDYKVHTRIVLELLDEKYTPLWQLDLDTLKNESPEVDLVIELAKRLGRIYAELQISPTDTLVTKVLLGTFGCIPAYDTFFVAGVTYWNKELLGEFKPKFPARFGVSSYRGLIEFYQEHKSDFREAQDIIAKHGVTYPIMRLADMYFWMLG